MKTLNTFLTLIVSSLYLAGCSGGGADSTSNPLIDDRNTQPVNNVLLDSSSSQSFVTNPELIDSSFSDDQARYRVTIENLWGVEDFPQGFPDQAHFSLIGGATHSAAVSFWELGDVASQGIEDMAEAGLIDKLLFDEVTPAITNGTANAMIEIREFTAPKIDGVPGVLIFDIEMHSDWPLLSMVTMLGPSPDWFVGVSGLSLHNDDKWTTQLSLSLPLYDAGTKSDITPIMGGPDIIPPNPIGLVAYEAATGVYLPSNEPQNVARLTFERLDVN